jgi:hypothetical protein
MIIPVIGNGTSGTLKIGPFISTADGSLLTTLTINKSDVKLSKAEGARATKNAAGGGTHDSGGYYFIDYDDTDSNTYGKLEVSVQMAGAFPVFDTWWVVEPALATALQNGAFWSAIAKEATLLLQAVKGVLMPQKPAKGEIELYRNRVQTITFNWGTNWDLTGKDVHIIIKADRDDDDSDAILDRQITVESPATNGIASLTTTVAEMAASAVVLNKYWYGCTTYDTGTTNNAQEPEEGVCYIKNPVRKS